jgi:hypothetical protein
MLDTAQRVNPFQLLPDDCPVTREMSNTLARHDIPVTHLFHLGSLTQVEVRRYCGDEGVEAVLHALPSGIPLPEDLPQLVGVAIATISELPRELRCPRLRDLALIQELAKLANFNLGPTRWSYTPVDVVAKLELIRQSGSGSRGILRQEIRPEALGVLRFLAARY